MRRLRSKVFVELCDHLIEKNQKVKFLEKAQFYLFRNVFNRPPQVRGLILYDESSTGKFFWIVGGGETRTQDHCLCMTISNYLIMSSTVIKVEHHENGLVKYLSNRTMTDSRKLQ